MPPVPNPVLVEMQATVDGYAELADKLRPGDVEECKAMGWAPRDALWFALADCPEGCFAVGSLARDSAKPQIVGAYGFNHRGNIWSLWAPLGTRETKCMLRHSNVTIQRLLEASGQQGLTNMVSLKNTGAMKWIARCPAIHIDRTQQRTYGDTPFAPFVAMRRK